MMGTGGEYPSLAGRARVDVAGGDVAGLVPMISLRYDTCKKLLLTQRPCTLN
jgi:hypothetical protein